MKRKAGIFAALALLLVTPYLMAPSGGFPYFPVFGAVQAVGKKNCGSDVASICATSTGVAHDRWALALRPAGGAGNILGEIVTCSGNSTDTCLRVDTAAGTSFKIDGAGAVTGLSGASIPTLSSGSYTATYVGCTTTPTSTVLYTVVGTPSAGMVSLRVSPNSCTSNSTSFTLTGAPASLRPATVNMSATSVDSAIDNTVVQTGNVAIFMDSAGTLNVLRNGSATGFTAAGTKGFSSGVVYSYPLQ